MELAEPQSRRWVVALVACAIIGVSLLPADTVFHLAIVAISTIMGGAIALTAVIAVTGRRLW